MKENYQISNILIPVDFSDRAKNAVVQACGIAKSKNAKVILYHAYSRPSDGTNLTAYELEHHLKQKVDKIDEKFKAFIDGIPELRHCTVETIAEAGISLQNIERAFKSMETDLMVMATHGARGVELMWGSKTTNLIHRLKGPILVMPDGSKLENPKKFCLAYNFDRKNQNVYALSTLKQIAEGYGAHIRIIDVRSHNYPKSDERLNEEEKLSLFLGDDVSHDFESIYSKDVEHALLNYVHEYKVDMLAIMPAEHNFFEKLFHQSLTELMAAEIDIPLLTLVDK